MFVLFSVSKIINEDNMHLVSSYVVGEFPSLETAKSEFDKIFSEENWPEDRAPFLTETNEDGSVAWFYEEDFSTKR